VWKVFVDGLLSADGTGGDALVGTAGVGGVSEVSVGTAGAGGVSEIVSRQCSVSKDLQL